MSLDELREVLEQAYLNAIAALNVAERRYEPEKRSELSTSSIQTPNTKIGAIDSIAPTKPIN
ncbi:hypothetical protein [Baaleninema sp.]|uniref:hypothetical protein n=1 Tax=Baaleninema sp. TaxID=3101197 RepID=UPI003CFC0161